MAMESAQKTKKKIGKWPALINGHAKNNLNSTKPKRQINILKDKQLGVK